MSNFVLSIDKLKHYHINLDIVAYRDSSQNEWVSFYNITSRDIAKELLAAREIYWYPTDFVNMANAVRITPISAECGSDLDGKFCIHIRYMNLCTLKIPKIIKKLKII